MADYGFVKVAAVSPRVRIANPSENAKAAFEAIRNMVWNERAQVVVLPELFLSAYTCADMFNNNALLDACLEALDWLEKKTVNINALIAVGMPLTVNERLYNCAVMIYEGRVVGVVPKTYIPNYGEFYEKRWFSSGKNARVTSCKVGNETAPFGKVLFRLNNEAVLGVEICEDLWVPVPPSSIMALGGANIIANLSASNELVAKNDYRSQLVTQQSARCCCAYVYADAGRGESTTDVVFSGACSIAENGTMLAESRRFERESFAVCDIDVQRLNSQRRKSAFFDNADDYSESFIVVDTPLDTLPKDSITRPVDSEPFVPSDTAKRAQRCEEILAIQTAGLAKRLSHINAKKAILGISGGLDSTLALLVTVRAFNQNAIDASNIICLTMPGFGTTAGTKNNACDLVRRLGCELREINIVPACEQHMRDIGHDMSVLDVTYENVQARERTQILMDLANKEGALLVGTGDLSELALGWCTYNGDHMSMYGVNCGVPKTLVRHLVKYIADSSDEALCATLNSVLETPISPELLPPDKTGGIAQKTEDSIGPYELHDFFLYYIMRYDFSAEKVEFLAERAFADKYSKGEIVRWLRVFIKRFVTNQFKRSCMPDGPKVGTISLSPRGDLRLPSDAEYGVFDFFSSYENIRQPLIK